MSSRKPASTFDQQPQVANNVLDFADWRVRLRGCGGDASEGVACHVRRVNETGLIVDTPAQLGRFAWMEVDLPDGTGVSVLGEVVERRDPIELAVEVRFKHLFPDHRARLLSALALQA